MTVVAFTIPGDPVAKGRPRFTRGGIAFTPSKTRGYEQLVKIVATEAMAGRAPIEGAVELAVQVNLPIPSSWSKRKQAMAIAGDLQHTSRPDTLNVVKSVEDGCNGIVWRDDSQIVRVVAGKSYGLPGVHVTVQPRG